MVLDELLVELFEDPQPPASTSVSRRSVSTGLSSCVSDPSLDWLPHVTPFPHRGRAVRGRARDAARSRPRAEGRAALLPGARRAQRRADLPEALDPHARVLRGRRLRAGRPPRRAALRRAPARARRGAARHRLVLSRHVAAIGVRTGPDAMLEELAGHSTVPVINMLTACTIPARRSPICSPCARPTVRSRGSASPTSATATTSPARWPCWARSRGCTSRWPRPPATRSSRTSRCPPALRLADAALRSARGGRGRRRRVHRRVGEHGR